MAVSGTHMYSLRTFNSKGRTCRCVSINVFTWAEILFRGQKQTVASLTMVPTCPKSLGTLGSHDCGCLLLLFPCLVHPAWPLFRQTLEPWLLSLS